MTADLKLINPEVTRISANKRNAGERHLGWHVGVAPTNEPIGEGLDHPPVRVIFGTLHAHGETGSVTAQVAALLSQPGAPLGEIEDLRGSPELETLYDIARIAVQSAAGVAGVQPDLPRESPEPKFEFLVLASDVESEDASPDESDADE